MGYIMPFSRSRVLTEWREAGDTGYITAGLCCARDSSLRSAYLWTVP
jgi:hypothetical protein